MSSAQWTTLVTRRSLRHVSVGSAGFHGEDHPCVSLQGVDARCVFSTGRLSSGGADLGTRPFGAFQWWPGTALEREVTLALMGVPPSRSKSMAHGCSWPRRFKRTWYSRIDQPQLKNYDQPQLLSGVLELWDERMLCLFHITPGVAPSQNLRAITVYIIIVCQL